MTLDAGPMDSGLTDATMDEPDATMMMMTGMCPSGPCDLVAQTGCPMPGQGCYYGRPMAGADPQVLCAQAGTAGLDDPCTNLNDCAPGLLCDGVCRAICCEQDSATCPTGQQCLINLVGADSMASGAGLCRAPDSCDVLEQTGCGMGEGCYAFGATGEVICVPSASGLDEGETCAAANDCSPGLLCSGAMGATLTCHRACDRTDNDPGCESAQTCTAIQDWPANIGVCTPAASP